MSLRSLLLKVHMFGGVLCAPYLLIFGISSLNYNHKPAFTDEWTDTIASVAPLRVENRDDNQALADEVKDSLGLWGWAPRWEHKRDEKKNLRFVVTRPGRKYVIQTDFESGEARIEAAPKGYWSVVRQLHALMQVPGSSLMSVWGVYTDICAACVLFSILSGVYLWTARKSERMVGLALLGAGSGSSLVLMVYLWGWG